MSEVFPWDQIPKAHCACIATSTSRDHVVLVSAPTTGLRTYEDVLEASQRLRRLNVRSRDRPMLARADGSRQRPDRAPTEFMR